MSSLPPYFCTTQSIHETAQQVLVLTLDRKTFFAIDLKKLDKMADWIIELTKRRYPHLKIPLHSRWRHFEIKGKNRADFLAMLPTEERLKAELDLATVSVLLDAGAGGEWQYRDMSGDLYSRSEGLALASLEMFAQGFFSTDSKQPWRAEAKVLYDLNVENLADKLQSHPDNEIKDLNSRLHLLQHAAFPGERPGDLDELIRANLGKSFAATELVNLLLLNGFNFNDVWEYSAVGLVPFHKLTLWLALSFIEPLQRAGFTVHELEKLPGLAEYRNGGLFLDGGVIEVENLHLLEREWRIADPLVVEWRALTLALLEKLADLIREKTGFKAKSLPLAHILQGGTWAAGRLLAYQKRAGGEPPIRCQTDSIF